MFFPGRKGEKQREGDGWKWATATISEKCQGVKVDVGQTEKDIHGMPL